LADPFSFVCPGAKSEPEAPSLAPDDPLDRSCDDPLDFNELESEFDMPAESWLPPVSLAPCANATGALNTSAAIATEYFNIFFSYADYPLSSSHDDGTGIPSPCSINGFAEAAARAIIM
jgi:hypothetical protein